MLNETIGIEAPVTATDVTAIDQEKVAKIKALVDAATSSVFYMSNSKRLATLEAALNIPVSDDKSFVGFFKHSRADLFSEAYKASRKSGTTCADVTNAQIIAEAQQRYIKKHGKTAVVNEEYLTA